MRIRVLAPEVVEVAEVVVEEEVVAAPAASRVVEPAAVVVGVTASVALPAASPAPAE